jgi:hypothetical protein
MRTFLHVLASFRALSSKKSCGSRMERYHYRRGCFVQRRPDRMHAVARYTDYEVMVFDLKKVSRHWRIVDSGEGTPTISTAWYGC